LGFSGSSTNKADRHDINEIWLKVALNTIKQRNKQHFSLTIFFKIKFTMIGVFVVYIYTGSPVPNIPSKSRGLAGQMKIKSF
jgi:hypothetical protein